MSLLTMMMLTDNQMTKTSLCEMKSTNQTIREIT